MSALRRGGGASADLILIVQDISQRKSAEQALRESERSKSVLLSHLPGLAYGAGTTGTGPWNICPTDAWT
jgi:PAS domain-containing protein